MRRWLLTHPPRILGVDNPSLTKAGLLPLKHDDGHWQVYVMKPPATKPNLVAPPFQIAKGTRTFCVNDVWQDCKQGLPDIYDALEPLAITALREAEEEIGLTHPQIDTWWNMGEVEFLSATKNTKKSMQLYAATLTTPLPDTPHACWLTLTQAQTLMRQDHFMIVEHVVAMLPLP